MTPALAACVVCLGLLQGVAGFKLQGQARSAQPAEGLDYGLVYDAPAAGQAVDDPEPDFSGIAGADESEEAAEPATQVPAAQEVESAAQAAPAPAAGAGAGETASVTPEVKGPEAEQAAEAPAAEVKEAPKSPKEDEPPAKVRYPIHVGDRMEVLALTGHKKGRWLACTVTGVDESGSYQIHVPSNPKDSRSIGKVPASALRHVPESQVDKSDGLLVFVAVTGKDYAVEQVKKNVDHLRATYQDRADVYLVHYDGEKGAWLKSGAEWYKKNVQFSEERQLPMAERPDASMLSAVQYYPPQVRLSKQLLPDLLQKRQYDYVWLLDDDVDFSSTNLTAMIQDARSSDALIASPSAFYFDATAQHRGADRFFVPGCGKASRMCFLHTPNKGCQYRYTNFVQAMFPILKPEAMLELAKCDTCDKIIDSLWCTKMARHLQHKPTQACAILDQTPVVHTNGKTLRKWEAVHGFIENNNEEVQALMEDRVEPADIQNLQCVRSI